MALPARSDLRPVIVCAIPVHRAPAFQRLAAASIHSLFALTTTCQKAIWTETKPNRARLPAAATGLHPTQTLGAQPAFTGAGSCGGSQAWQSFGGGWWPSGSHPPFVNHYQDPLGALAPSAAKLCSFPNTSTDGMDASLVESVMTTTRGACYVPAASRHADLTASSPGREGGEPKPLLV